MDLWAHIAGTGLGLLLVLVVLRSALQVAIVNRQRGDWLARQVGQVVYAGLRRLARRQRDYGDVQDVLAWILPLYMLLLIVVWFSLVQAGFSLLIWSSQSEHSVLEAVIASGSALSTLGFLTPPGIPGQLLAILEGTMGLGIILFYFTFIPGYQQVVQTCEAKVTWLYARGRAGLTNFALIEWLLSGSGEPSALWEDWEAWFRNLHETHALTPVLAFGGCSGTGKRAAGKPMFRPCIADRLGLPQRRLLSTQRRFVLPHLVRVDRDAFEPRNLPRPSPEKKAPTSRWSTSLAQGALDGGTGLPPPLREHA